MKRQHFDLYLMIGNISIDGFKRERYVLKIKNFSDEIAHAQALLHAEEMTVEFCARDEPHLGDSLDSIMRLLLQIETLEQDRAKLQDKLLLREAKWIENDRLFKERRVALMQVLQLGLALMCDVAKALYREDATEQHSVARHERALVMIDQTLAGNREQSQRFLIKIG